MEYKKNTYIVLAVVFLLSIIATWLVHASEFFKGLIAMPAIMALVAAIYQIARDQAAFEKQKYFDDRRRIFDIGATSHMANTAFDKHMIFCEEYMQEVRNTLEALFTNGPSSEAITHANNSLLLRQKYAIWLTDEINIGLEPYEKVVRKIGVDSCYIKETINDLHSGKNRQKAIKEMYEKFNEVLGLNDSIKEVEEEYAAEAVKKRIKEILGIEELTRIRKYLIAEAVAALEKNN